MSVCKTKSWTILDSSYTVSEPITITSPEDFETYGFPRAGTEESPYRIEDLLITTTNKTACIRVDLDEQVYYQIANCNLSASSWTALVSIGGVAFIRECIVHDSNSGIYVESNGSIVTGCRIEDCRSGISVSGTDTVIRNNTVLNFGMGIEMLNPTYGCVIENNTLLQQNNCSECVGIMCQRATSLMVKSNTIHSTGNGLSAAGVDIAISGNSFYSYDAAILTVWNSQISDSGSSENVSITDCEFFSEGANTGLHATFTDGLVVTGCTFGPFTRALMTTNAPDFTISDCVFGIPLGADNPRAGWQHPYEGHGIHVGGHNGTIIHSTFRGLDLGLEVWGEEIAVENNTFTENYDGIEMYGKNNSIYYNTFFNNLRYSAIDNGEGNLWDDGVSLGNYWDPGITGNIRPINGTADAVDRYPVLITSLDLDSESFPLGFIFVATSIVTVLVVAILVKYRK